MKTLFPGLTHLAVFAILTALASAGATAWAETWTVTDLTTLVPLISQAQDGDVIVVADSLSGQTVTLSSYEVVINKSLTIQGPSGGLTISGGGRSRIFEVGALGHVSLSRLTITQGNAQLSAFDNPGDVGTDGLGGAILNWGALTLSNCVVSASIAASGGGGIFNGATADLTTNTSTVSTLTLNQCTVTGNAANSYGGGILNAKGCSMTLLNSTVCGNTAPTGPNLYNKGRLRQTNSDICKK